MNEINLSCAPADRRQWNNWTDIDWVRCEAAVQKLQGRIVKSHLAEVCPLSRRSDVETPIRPVTGRHSLFLRSHTRTSFGFPCGRLTCPKAGEIRVYQVSRK
jgi:hypothetical protein